MSHSTTTFSSIEYDNRSSNTSLATTPNSLFSDFHMIPVNHTPIPTFNYYDTTELWPIFPSNTNPIRTFSTPLTQSVQQADHWPIGFHDTIDWARIWNGPQHRLDRFLRYAHTADDSRIPWTYENTFKGAWFRITIDHRKSLTDLPNLMHGDVISIQNWNCDQSRYIVDHCVYHDDMNAYLKVYAFTPQSQIYDISSLRPPLVLALPLDYCSTRVHPNCTNINNQTNFLTTCKTQIKSFLNQVQMKIRKFL
jgi:hypothetical protein